MSNRLPYVFDLLYDIKTLDELNNHLSGRQRSATSATDLELYQLANENGVVCDSCKVMGEPEMRMVALLKHLTKPECGVMPDLVTKIKELLKETGHGDH